MSVEIRAADPEAQPGAGLLADMVAEIVDLYGRSDGHERGYGVTPEQLRPPEGEFLLLWEDGEAVACGGLKRLNPETAEIKRMYVRPGARSRGHARQVLLGLEEVARGLGYERVRLDTGRLQPHARALYEAAGYGRIPDYNGNPRASYWFEKRL